MPSPSTSRRAKWALGALVAGYLMVDLVAGVPGSPLVPAMPEGVPAPAWAVRAAGWAGLDQLGRTALTFASVALLAGLVACFLIVALEAWRGNVGVATVMGATVVCLVLAVAAPLLLSRDVYSYAAYGRMLALGGANPYVRAPSAFPADPFTGVVSSEWLQTRSVYGPAFTLLSAVIARVWAGSPEGTILAFKAVAGVAVALTAGLTALACRAWRPERSALAAAVVGLNPVLVVHTAGGGHNDALLAVALGGALLLGSRRRPRARSFPGVPAVGITALLTLATWVKVVAALPLVVWLWWAWRDSRGDWARSMIPHVAVVAVITIGVWAPVYPGWHGLTAMAGLASREGWASGPRLVARGAQAIGDLLGGAEIGAALAKVTYGAFLAVFALSLWLSLRRGDLRYQDGWGVSLLLFALAAPYLLPWYVAWFAPVLALMDDEVLTLIGVAVACVLALTGVPAEPEPSVSLWRGMVLGVHYIAAPVALALFVLAVRRVLSRRGLTSDVGLG